MNELVKKIITSDITSIFTARDLYNAGFNRVYVDEMLQEAVMRYDIINIKDDIYTLGKMLRKEFITDEVLAQKLVPDSYVSLEFVLSQISWIPEAVYVVTCVTRDKSKRIETQFGRYEYVTLPIKEHLAGVRNYVEGINEYKKASPLKALADIICERDYNWTTLEPLYESFRIEYDNLETLTKEDFEELHETYGVSNVESFLVGIRKELGL
jgi:hypothetical protein